MSPSWTTSTRTCYHLFLFPLPGAICLAAAVRQSDLNLLLCLAWFADPITPGPSRAVTFSSLLHSVGFGTWQASGWAVLQTLCISTVLMNAQVVRIRGSNGRSLPLMEDDFLARKVQGNYNFCLQVHLQNKSCWKRGEKTSIERKKDDFGERFYSSRKSRP